MSAQALPGTVAEVQASPRGPQVGAFFDLDGTLVAGFTASAMTKEQQRRGDHQRSDVLKSLGPMIAFARGKLEFAEMLALGTASMAGQTADQIAEMGQRVFDSTVRDLVYPEMRRLVQAHLDQGHTVVLSSSALTLQVEPVAEYLGIEHVLCNRLEEEDGVLTGAVAQPVIWGSGKSDAVQTFARDHGVDLGRSYFYADGNEDLALMYLVGKPRPTNPRSQMEAVAKRRRWPILRFTSRGGSPVGKVAKMVASLGSMAPLAAGGFAVGLITQDKWRGLNVLLGNYPALLLQVSGVTLHVQGREHLEAARPAVFIFNHRTNSDGIVAASLIGHDFTGVAKKELEKDPFMGPVGRFMETAHIDRNDTESAVAALKRIEALAAKGISVLIAPEGTRMDTTSVGSFKKGAFRMAMAAGIPIVPIIIRNAEDIAGKDSHTMNPGDVDVVVGEPIPTDDWQLTELPARIAQVRQLYVETLANWPGRDEA